MPTTVRLNHYHDSCHKLIHYKDIVVEDGKEIDIEKETDHYLWCDSCDIHTSYVTVNVQINPK